MPLPTLHGIGRLTGDPELNFAASGTAVCKVNVAYNSRKKGDNGEWEDGDTLFLRGIAFRELAENIAESLSKGDEVVIAGRVKLDQWVDKDSGEKRSAPGMLIDLIGPNLRYATAAVRKANRTPGSSWDNTAVAATAQTEEPPF